MKLRTLPLGRILPVLVLLALLAILVSGCDTDTPQNTFDTKGEVAEKQAELFYWSMWPALAIMIFVLSALVIMLLRFRERDPNHVPPQIHGNTRLELAWTIAPAVLLLGLGIPVVASIYDLGREPSEDAFVINVTGQRFSWDFEYPEFTDANGDPLVVSSLAGPAHIPVDREVAFYLRSVDVIHSFWIPKLGGKLDVVPNDDNVLWLIADEPGSFSGQCAEFCGLYHADMRLTVVAEPEDEFEAWADEQMAE
ncbi:MAG: cytochrome c oxidase subunit II [Dehalococcoidia bacterium]